MAVPKAERTGAERAGIAAFFFAGSPEWSAVGLRNASEGPFQNRDRAVLPVVHLGDGLCEHIGLQLGAVEVVEAAAKVGR